MKINITETLEKARCLLAEDKQISPALKAMFEMLLIIVNLLSTKLGFNSSNSNKPPASDPNRKKKKKRKKITLQTKNQEASLAVWGKI